MKWFCRDWRADGRLKLCSLAACGLWADLLALMHDEGEPYGHLCVAGKALRTPAEIASAIGRQVKEVRGPLKELLDHGVPSLTEEGCLYSRRMVRDEDIRQRRAAGGSLGGNPNLVGEPKDNLPSEQEDNGSHARGRALASGLSVSAVEVGEETATPNSSTAVKVAERTHHLAALDSVAPGFAEAWESWRASLSSANRWTAWAEVLKLRTFREIATRRTPEELLSMVHLGAERSWRGFKEAWWERERSEGSHRNGSRRPPPGAFGADDQRRQQAVDLDKELGLR